MDELKGTPMVELTMVQLMGEPIFTNGIVNSSDCGTFFLQSQMRFCRGG
jgi:hypothetical protein